MDVFFGGGKNTRKEERKVKEQMDGPENLGELSYGMNKEGPEVSNGLTSYGLNILEVSRLTIKVISVADLFYINDLHWFLKS